MMLFVGTKMMKSLYCNNMQLPYHPMYDGKGKEQVLDMGLQMSGVYQV